MKLPIIVGDKSRNFIMVPADSIRIKRLTASNLTPYSDLVLIPNCEPFNRIWKGAEHVCSLNTLTRGRGVEIPIGPMEYHGIRYRVLSLKGGVGIKVGDKYVMGNFQL